MNRPKLILFDAVGTLFHLPKGVGHHYAHVGQRIGLNISAADFDRAFARVWKEMPARETTGAPRVADDKEWWRELVERVFAQVAPQTQELDRDNFFEIAYEHFAEFGVWELFPETRAVLEELHPHFQLGVVSNFDGRLRLILEQFGLTKFFSVMAISSEIGADKPDPLIFQRAMEMTGVSPDETLHVGDELKRDGDGAKSAGLQFFHLQRPQNSLRDLESWVGWDSNPQPTP